MAKSSLTFLSIFTALVIVLVLSQFGYSPSWQVIFHGIHALWSDTTKGNFLHQYAGLSWTAILESLRLILMAMAFTFVGAVLLTIIPLRLKWKPAVAVFEFLSILFESVPDTIYVIMTVALVVYLLETFNINLPAFDTLSPTWNDTWIPAIALSLPGAFYLRRIMTLQLYDEMRAPYVDTARAKGASVTRIFYSHVFPNMNSTLIRQIPVVATIVLSTSLFAEFFMEYKGQMFQLANAAGIDVNTGMTTTPYHSGTIFFIGALLIFLWWFFHFGSELIHGAMYPSGIVTTSAFRSGRIQWYWVVLGGSMLFFVLIVGTFPHLLTPFTATFKDPGPAGQVGPPFAPLKPSPIHPFGTDMFGHDILAQTLYGTLETLWPAAIITVCVLLGSLLLSTFAITTSSRAIVAVLKFVSQTLSALPAFLVLFLVLYHRTDVTWLQYLQYIAWFVLFEIGRGSYAFYQMMSQWYQFTFIEGVKSIGKSPFAILFTHLRSWLSRHLLEFSFSEFVRVLSLMAQLATLHVYVTVVIGFLPFRPYKSMRWPHGIISHFPNWLGMIGDSTLSMTYLSYPFFLAAPLLALTITVVGGNLVAKGIRGAK